eukprot:gene575-465_t
MSSATVGKKKLNYSCPGCDVEHPLSCEIFQTNFKESYPVTCESCNWSGDVQPFKSVDFFCPSCQSWWRGHKVRISGRSWLEFLSITFFCTTCASEVTAKPCQILRFECGSEKCQAAQAMICDPWAEPGRAPVSCKVCAWTVPTSTFCCAFGCLLAFVSETVVGLHTLPNPPIKSKLYMNIKIVQYVASSNTICIMPEGHDGLRNDSLLRHLRKNAPLWAAEVPLIDCPSPDVFFREYVSKNRPVIVRGLLGNCIAAERWSNLDYLSDIVGHKKISVNYTPHGFGDCCVSGGDGKKYFVQPHNEQVKFSSFLDAISKRSSDANRGIPYLSQQNDSLRQEFPELMSHLEDSSIMQFGDAVFQKSCDAINLWIGNESSVSKLVRLDEQILPSGEWIQVGDIDTNDHIVPFDESWSIRLFPSVPTVPWVCRNISEDSNDLHILHVEVKAGETLYLPALWYHQVSQTELTIAINSWHDMEFDCKWVYFQLMRDFLSLDPLESDSDSEQ